MTFITAIFGFFFSSEKTTKITMIVLLIALAVVGTFVGMKMWEIKGLKSDIKDLNGKNTELTVANTILTSNNAVLKSNQVKLAQANDQNLETIKDLQKERADSEHLIATLAAQDKKTKDALAKSRQTIAEMLKDPKNNGTVSPILKEVVRQIQSRGK